MLAAEFAFAVTPAAVRDDACHARIDAAGINADRTAKTRSDDADAIRIDRRMLGQEVQRIAGVFDLLETDHAAELAFAFAAAAHVKSQRDVTVFVEDAGRRDAVRAVAVRAEAMQHQEGRAAIARLDARRHAHHAVQAQTRRLETHNLFAHNRLSFPILRSGRHSTDLAV